MREITPELWYGRISPIIIIIMICAGATLQYLVGGILSLVLYIITVLMIALFATVIAIATIGGN